MGSDRDGKEFFDAAGKRRTAKECNYVSDNHEDAVVRSVCTASEQTVRRGSGQSFEQSAGRNFDKRRKKPVTNGGRSDDESN